jgi:hypothetical protein
MAINFENRDGRKTYYQTVTDFRVKTITVGVENMYTN